MYHDASLTELVSDIKGIQIVLKKVILENNLSISHEFGQFDKKNVIDIDQVEDDKSDEDSDDFGNIDSGRERTPDESSRTSIGKEVNSPK